MSVIGIFLFHTVRINYSGIFLGGFIQYLFNSLPLALDVFFVLSSFLLTYLALNEYTKRGNFSFRNYFTRRVLRIWPLYYFILILAFILFPFLANLLHVKMTLPPPLFYAFYIANFYTIDHVFFLKFLWTISVEEQFYLLWGFCLRFFHRNLNKIIAILFLVSISFSLYAVFNGIKYYFNTITYLFDFASGALGALLIFRNSRVIRRLRNLSLAGTIVFYAYLSFHFIFFYFLNDNTTGTANELAGLTGRYLFILYIAVFMVEQMINISRTKVFEKNRFLIFTGKISYGLYCFHGITIMIINLCTQHFKINLHNWLFVLICFAVNYFIAYISYRYLELPFLKLKSKWRRI